jgi:hypothetical protein
MEQKRVSWWLVDGWRLSRSRLLLEAQSFDELVRFEEVSGGHGFAAEGEVFKGEIADVVGGFSPGFDEVEIDLQVHIGAVAVFDVIGDDTSIADEIGIPEACGLVAVPIKDVPGLVVIEAELLDGVVLVLQRHMPLADDLRSLAVLLELTRETGLCWVQVEVLLALAVEDHFEAVLKGIASGEQLSTRG